MRLASLAEAGRTVVQWPAEQFYWGLLEAPGWSTTAGVLPPSLRERFDEEVPEAAGDVHAVCVAVSGGRLLVCGIAKSRLAELDSGTLSLVPASVPDCVQVDLPSVEGLNLLIGEFEPISLRRARTRRHVFAAAAILVCALLLSVGFVRRANHSEARAMNADERVGRLLASVKPTPTSQSLAAELARLEETAAITQSAKSNRDASLVLGELLKRWPSNVPSKPQSISVTGVGATISVSVEGDPSPFLRSFAAPDGWTMAEPRLNTTDNVTRLALQFHPAEGKGNP